MFLSVTDSARSGSLILAALLLIVLTGPNTQAQSGTQIEITFVEEQKEAAREQLRRIFEKYPLDPWIITTDIQVEVNVDPHSKPILTMNTNYLDSDLIQLSIFVHEQAHWLPYEKREQAIKALAERYPDINGLPSVDSLPKERKEKILEYKESVYNHLIIAWVELDAMTELVGDEVTRSTIQEKLQRIVSKPYSPLEQTFVWYYETVLAEPQAIGAILAQHDLMITPEKGIVVEYSD